MQDYSYSVFSLVAIAIHIITNFDLLVKAIASRDIRTPLGA